MCIQCTQCDTLVHIQKSICYGIYFGFCHAEFDCSTVRPIQWPVFVCFFCFRFAFCSSLWGFSIRLHSIWFCVFSFRLFVHFLTFSVSRFFSRFSKVAIRLIMAFLSSHFYLCCPLCFPVPANGYGKQEADCIHRSRSNICLFGVVSIFDKAVSDKWILSRSIKVSAKWIDQKHINYDEMWFACDFQPHCDVCCPLKFIAIDWLWHSVLLMHTHTHTQSSIVVRCNRITPQVISFRQRHVNHFFESDLASMLNIWFDVGLLMKQQWNNHAAIWCLLSGANFNVPALQFCNVIVSVFLFAAVFMVLCLPFVCEKWLDVSPKRTKTTKKWRFSLVFFSFHTFFFASRWFSSCSHLGFWSISRCILLIFSVFFFFVFSISLFLALILFSFSCYLLRLKLKPMLFFLFLCHMFSLYSVACTMLLLSCILLSFFLFLSPSFFLSVPFSSVTHTLLLLAPHAHRLSSHCE